MAIRRNTIIVIGKAHNVIKTKEGIKMGLKGHLVWDKRERQEIEEFSNEYKKFIEFAKTERLTIAYFEDLLKKSGFIKVEEFTGVEDQVYLANRSKSLIAVKRTSKMVSTLLLLMLIHLVWILSPIHFMRNRK